MSLRRWASYPMILGRVRRSYKHVMLVDVKKVLLLGDPLSRVKNQSPESVFLSSTPPPSPPLSARHRPKNSENTHQKTNTINPAVIMGGVRGVRRLSAAMLTEIVRATTNKPHNKRKNSVTESGMLSRLAMNEFTLKTIRLVTSSESIREARFHCLHGLLTILVNRDYMKSKTLRSSCIDWLVARWCMLCYASFKL
ncbi:unnamed protein product [Lactuca virosa]|uniref:DUF7780 domain-containing protein n=1 Tax=Lactuca virosa TaxID=75947 RepID=A0AAU9N0H9_9ASTR|nr:unnamed protein product [Lactuca virosa]